MNILENKPFSSPACKSIANDYGASCIEIIIYGLKSVDAGTDTADA